MHFFKFLRNVEAVHDARLSSLRCVLNIAVHIATAALAQYSLQPYTLYYVRSYFTWSTWKHCSPGASLK